MIIVVEGADGCGKDAVADALAKRIGAARLNFPNAASTTGPMIRDYLRKAWYVPVYGTALDSKLYSALAFQALQITNRLEATPLLIDAALDEPEGPRWVLARYWQSGWVYGQLDGLDRRFLLLTGTALVQPHLNLLLDAPAEVCLTRRAQRDGASRPERYEGNLDVTRQVVDLYRELWAYGKEDLEGAWHVLDATAPLNEVIDAAHQCFEGGSQ